MDHHGNEGGQGIGWLLELFEYTALLLVGVGRTFVCGLYDAARTVIAAVRD